MSQFPDILAKSNPSESLLDHTNTVLKIWDQLRERYSSIIGNKEFWKDSFYSVLFHDFGKICDNFQEMLRGQRATNDDERVRHEFFSGMFLFANDHQYYLKNPLPLVAIFSHHKAFNDEGFNKHISRNRYLKHNINERLIDEFLLFVDEKSKYYGVEELSVNEKLKFYILQDYTTLYTHYRERFYDYLKTDGVLNQNERREYILFKAILNISDWTASGHLLLEKGFTYSNSDLKEKIIHKLLLEGKKSNTNNFSFKEFQIRSTNKKNVIAIAPTGSGKTEAALLWASDKKEWERIIYLLPTRVTSNAIYDRLRDYFGNKNVSLIHSTARLYQKENVDNDYDQKKYFRDKTFFKNINVCTIDQILTQGFNLGFWEVKTFHLLNAKVIIDEIHLYSPYTLGLIISSIKYLKNEFSATFYIMTATMPTKLLNLLQEAIYDVHIIRDTQLLNEARNIFEIRENTIDELLDEIKGTIAKGKKTMVVVNSVDKAIEVYDKLKKTADHEHRISICYHSRFINKDRSKKEKDIFNLDRADNGGVLVATQVVEVSLDIDFDMLFTENAPIDAIIQRAGRINRKRLKNNTKVIIAKHYDISEKIYEVDSILDRSYREFQKRNGDYLTESQLTEMVDSVYADMNIDENDSYKEGLNKYLNTQNHLNFIKDLSSDERVFTRENLDRATVIPYCCMEKLISETSRDELTKHELSISKFRFDLLQKYDGPFGSKFIDAPYSFEKGLEFKKQEDISDFVSIM